MTVRQERLRRLGETFWVRYGDGPVEDRWPKEPKRYAYREFSERYGEDFWNTADTLAEIEGVIGDVDKVVDLDTGQEIPFAVHVAWG